MGNMADMRIRRRDGVQRLAIAACLWRLSRCRASLFSSRKKKCLKNRIGCLFGFGQATRLCLQYLFDLLKLRKPQ
jgi:hypothetical protein